MKILAISDLHGFLPPVKQMQSDILLIGGDLVPDDFSGTGYWDRQSQAAWMRTEFSDWLEAVPSKWIVGIAGNHDFVLEGKLGYQLPWHYLNDESIEIEGIKIHGSPMSPEFGGWAFMRPDSQLVECWNKIPEDTNILMVHAPMHGFCDLTSGEWGPQEHVGSASLRNKFEYGAFPNLKAFVCGHIHPAYGKEVYKGVNIYNVSYVDHDMLPTNSPRLIQLGD